MAEETPAVSTPDPIAPLLAQLAAANARLIQAELRAQATVAGIIDIDCLKMLDTSSFKLDEQGNLPDAKTALATLKREKPWMFGQRHSSHPAPAPTPAAEPSTARMAKDMTHEEWQTARSRLLRGR